MGFEGEVGGVLKGRLVGFEGEDWWGLKGMVGGVLKGKIGGV